MNLVELFSEDKTYNQKCVYGCLVPGHAVYCHSVDKGAPRKCKRSWYTGGAEKDEDCPYFKLNENYSENGV